MTYDRVRASERLRQAIRSLVAQMQHDRKAKTYTVRHGDAVLASGVAYEVAVDVDRGTLTVLLLCALVGAAMCIYKVAKLLSSSEEGAIIYFLLYLAIGLGFSAASGILLDHLVEGPFATNSRGAGEKAKCQARNGDAITADKLRLMSRQADVDMEHITAAMRAAEKAAEAQPTP